MNDTPISPSDKNSNLEQTVVEVPVSIPYPKRRVRVGLSTTLIGFLVFLMGNRPSLFGLDRSPVIGFVQIAVFLIGLALICIGGYLSLAALWMPGTHSISADIGLRLVATGYLISVFSGMADVFGFGSHISPMVPFFGPWQARGVEIGEIIIAVGFLLLIPYNHREKQEKK
jgi:hypothetical protein